MLRQRLEQVRERIQQACRRADRNPSTVTLIGVTKGVPVEVIEEAVGLGLDEIGENRVQEAQEKYTHLAPRHPGLRWHFIGHLQRNKAKTAVQLFEMIHSVDSVVLIQALEAQAAQRLASTPLQVLIQVNVASEPTKHGCRSEETNGLAHAIRQAPHLHLAGLMTLAPYADDPEAARPIFRRLRQLRDQLQAQHAGSLLLSMGMSNDFAVAVEEGADLVRIGTAIFGTRA